MGVDVHGGAGREHDEHQPGALGHWQRSEAEAFGIDVAEELAVGHTHQLTARVVRPIVIGAREPTSDPNAIGHHDRTAMAARIEKRAHCTIGAAREQHRRFHDREGLVRAGLANLAPEGEHERKPAKEIDLSLPEHRIEIVRDRHAIHALGLARRIACLNMGDVLARHVDELVPAHGRPRMRRSFMV